MLKQYLKRLVFKHTSFGKPRYNFGVEPIQLTTIINAIEKVASKKSSFNLFEIGVARGLTTRFIAEHIRNQHYNCDYYCINTFSYNFNQHSCIDIVFLDVDLYIPTQHVLSAISDLVQTGSTIIVDDVKDNNSWDGAYQAFMEHVNTHDLPYSIIRNKCGVISI